ncbi:hypothetical protein M0804_009343 [Polistes exclamans]|nr:hypothetical protein M0804_009343 [Polistes exclamans]
MKGSNTVLVKSELKIGQSLQQSFRVPTIPTLAPSPPPSPEPPPPQGTREPRANPYPDPLVQIFAVSTPAKLSLAI